MSRRCVDPDFTKLRENIGEENFRKLYIKIYTKTLNHGNARFSGKRYLNSKEHLSMLKEKYKNGVPEGIISEMLGFKNGQST